MGPRSCSHLNYVLRRMTTCGAEHTGMHKESHKSASSRQFHCCAVCLRFAYNAMSTGKRRFCASSLSRPSRGGSARGASLRAISSARLCASLHLHLRPINVVVCDGPRGDLILRTASCLDAFSAYPFPTWLPSGAPGGTTGGPEVGPARSSRTSASTAQISNAHDR